MINYAITINIIQGKHCGTVLLYVCVGVFLGGIFC